MVSSTLFIGAIIIGVTQFIKLMGAKSYWQAAIIVLAAIVGALVGIFDIHMGIVDISVAQGIMIGLAAPGVVTLAEKIG